MTPQVRLVVLLRLITIKIVEFENFSEPGADGYVLLVGCFLDSDQAGKITDVLQVSQTDKGCQMLENMEDSIFCVSAEDLNERQPLFAAPHPTFSVEYKIDFSQM